MADEDCVCRVCFLKSAFLGFVFKSGRDFETAVAWKVYSDICTLVGRL